MGPFDGRGHVNFYLTCRGISPRSTPRESRLRELGSYGLVYTEQKHVHAQILVFVPWMCASLCQDPAT